MSTIDEWFPYRRATADVELFAFPHAGAGVTVFSGLREALEPCGVSLSPAMLPGRERRFRQDPHASMGDLLADVEGAAAVDGFAAFSGEYALLGHCSGALVAYELARILERSPCRDPRLLVVCSCPAPPFVRDTGTSRLPTGDLVVRTAQLGGTAGVLMDDPDFLEMLERPLRADWTLFDSYLHAPSAPLRTPILAVRGAADPDVRAEDARAWRQQTEGAFLARDVDAGHWMLTESGSAALAREIPAALAAVQEV